MKTGIEFLKPEAGNAASLALKDLKGEGIVEVAVTSTLRTTEEQVALYAQGRKSLNEVNQLRTIAGLAPLPAAENTYTVTNADGITNKSNHQSGLALDVVPVDKKGNPTWPGARDSRWALIAKAFKKRGFSWGGDWENPDFPHYEYKGSV